MFRAVSVGVSFVVGVDPGVLYLLEGIANSTFVDNGGAGITFTGVSAVPIPGAALLFGTALFGLGWIRRRASCAAKRVSAELYSGAHA